MVKTIGVSAIIKYNNKYIFEIQKPHKWYYQSNGTLNIGIGCIGGSIEADESPNDALRREAIEEIGTNIEIVKWSQAFTITSDLEVSNTDFAIEDNLFFEWYSTRERYKECRICVFVGKTENRPFPGDLPGLLITDIELLIKCLRKKLTVGQCLDAGMDIISRAEIPLMASFHGVGTVERLMALYENHKSRLDDLL